MFEGKNGKCIEEIGDAHASSSAETPLRADAFEMSDAKKMEAIEGDVAHICTR